MMVVEGQIRGKQIRVKNKNKKIKNGRGLKDKRKGETGIFFFRIISIIYIHGI